MVFTVLGSGTSSGVPTVSCMCSTCTSTDVKDKRLRTSLLVQSETTTVLIDTTPDLRQQMLQHKVRKLDAVIYTHYHFDHIGGFDDLRAFNYTSQKPMSIYLNDKTLAHLKRTFFYAFEEPEQTGGGITAVDIHLIETEKFTIGDIEFIPILLKHGVLDVLGFRIGDFAYCTDTNFIPDFSLKKLEGVKYLILDALRHTSHPTHFSLKEAILEVYKIHPTKAYFIHLAHQIKHSEVSPNLPQGIFLSYDGLKIEV